MVRYGDGARPGGSRTYARGGRDYRDRDFKERERDRPFRDAYGRSPARQRDAGGHRYDPLCQLLGTPLHSFVIFTPHPGRRGVGRAPRAAAAASRGRAVEAARSAPRATAHVAAFVLPGRIGLLGFVNKPVLF